MKPTLALCLIVLCGGCEKKHPSPSKEPDKLEQIAYRLSDANFELGVTIGGYLVAKGINEGHPITSTEQLISNAWIARADPPTNPSSPKFQTIGR